MCSPNRQDVMHVLLIEDNPGDAILIKESLEEADAACHITVARDGEGALALLCGDAGQPPLFRPDLVLLDLNLPRMDGHEVLRELKTREQFRPIPVIVLTSSRTARDVTAAYNLHCNAYFCKPATFNECVQLTRLIVDFWQRAVPNRPAVAQESLKTNFLVGAKMVP